MLVLGIESSCDETGVALYSRTHGLLAHRLHTQMAMHAEYGGVVPELASRDHIRRLVPLTRACLADAGKSHADIDAVAYTQGPGLGGALLAGASYANALAFALGKPVIPVHHLEGHLLSPLLSADPPPFPFVALLVSGGHTQFMAVRGIGDYTLLGESVDDAAGEAFDKTAKLMGLPYPGGPELAALAEQGDANRFPLPRPMTNRPGMDFSFSGLKTQVRLLIEEHLEKQGDDAQTRADIAAAFQQAVIETLAIKCHRAWQETGYRDLVVAGGVSANRLLRQTLQQEAEKQRRRVYFPPLALCGDNALMIAFAAAQRYDGHDSPLDIAVQARWDLATLPPHPVAP